MTESMKFGPEWLRALSAQQPARYQLAEFRYGREEMLALFSANLPPPESLKQLHGLFVEKAQPPLALNTMSDEETRMWNRGINSDAVLRSSGKGERGGGLRASGGGSTGGRGGRGRGGSAFYRGSGERYEESGDAPFARQRPFDRSQSERGRDSWSERNGGEGRGGGRDRERERERDREPNWRRGQRNSGGGGDEDDWRPYSSSNKWSVTGGRSNNWRDEDNYEMIQTHSSKNSNHHLPEWATEKNSEGGGTFDSSGAFHGPSDHCEEDEPKKNENQRVGGKERDRERDRDKGSSNKSDPVDKEKYDQKLEARESPKESKPPEEEMVNHKPETTPPRVHSPKRTQLNSISQQQPQPLSQPTPVNSRLGHSQQNPPQQSQLHLQRVRTPSPPLPSVVSTPPLTERKSPPHPPAQLLQSQPPLAYEHKSPPREIQHPPPAIHQSVLEHQEDVLSNMTDSLAADLVAKLMEDEEKQDKQWFYRDPQGQVQGPFTCTEMAEWFQSGYFTLNLMVRRACDPNYAPLGELIKLWGCIPFLPEFHPLNKEAATMLNNQMQENMFMQQYQQQMRNMFYRQQQQQPRHQVQPPPVPKIHDWLDTRQNLMEPILPPQYQAQVGASSLHQQQSNTTNNHLRALLAQLQQQAKADPAPTPVMDTLISLAHQQQQATTGQTPIQALLRQMQQQSSKMQHHPQQQQQQPQQQHHPSATPPSNAMDSVWNGGGNWSQWGHVNTKGIKTEQQVIEEQLRAEFLRKRDELLKVAEEVEAKGKEEEEKAKKEREKQQQQQEVAKREEECLQRRRAEEEEIRKKQEASRRAEVERQKKGEEKRRKEEEKRKKEEEKRRKEEENRERERLREEERKKKEAEEAKKRSQAAADVMAKVQRSQWCPPAASNTSILDIQRSEREQQQLLRGLQQQAQQHLEQQQQQQQQQQNIGNKGGLQLKWTEPTARPQTQVESLADIQAEQQRQFLKQLEKEKERDKEKVTASTISTSSLGSWSQGLSWGNSAWQTPGLNPGSGIPPSQKGFWEYDKVSATAGSGRLNNVIQTAVQQPEPPKSVQNKAKREEQAVMKLFSQPVQPEEDEFSQWCSRQLLSIHANVDIPTFVSFLREVDSPAEIMDYVRLYLGDSKESSDFARQFVERRGFSGGGRLNSSGIHSMTSQDDRDFQQVKGKSKKTKKGRMQKVDTRMLGFSTTAAPDRINVGDREYPE